MRVIVRIRFKAFLCETSIGNESSDLVTRNQIDYVLLNKQRSNIILPQDQWEEQSLTTIIMNEHYLVKHFYNARIILRPLNKAEIITGARTA